MKATFEHELVKRMIDEAVKAEREACAEIAESKRHAPHFVLTSMPSQNGTAVDIANLIRARGQA
jgi:hypothetical protein